jgi:hypothetical protein
MSPEPRVIAATLIAVLAHLLIALAAAGGLPSFPPKAWAEEGSNREREIVFDLKDVVDPASGGPGTGAEARAWAASPALRATPVAARTGARAAETPRGESLLDDPFTDWFLHRSGGLVSRGSTSSGASTGGASTGGDPGTGGGPGGASGSGDRSGKGAPKGGRARAATLLPNWDCHYPGETEHTGIVRMLATVRPDGTTASVQILDDPGNGFAQVAIDCAMRQPFLPALDERGVPVEGKTRPFIVRFIH